MRYAALGTSGYSASTPVRSLTKMSHMEPPVRSSPGTGGYSTGFLIIAFEDAKGQRIAVLPKR